MPRDFLSALGRRSGSADVGESVARSFLLPKLKILLKVVLLRMAPPGAGRRPPPEFGSKVWLLGLSDWDVLSGASSASCGGRINSIPPVLGACDQRGFDGSSSSSPSLAGSKMVGVPKMVGTSIVISVGEEVTSTVTARPPEGGTMTVRGLRSGVLQILGISAGSSTGRCSLLAMTGTPSSSVHASSSSSMREGGASESPPGTIKSSGVSLRRGRLPRETCESSSSGGMVGVSGI